MELEMIDWPTAAPVLELDEAGGVVWTATAEGAGYSCNGYPLIVVGNNGITADACKTRCIEYTLGEYTQSYTEVAEVYGYHAVLSTDLYYRGRFDQTIEWITTAILKEYTESIDVSETDTPNMVDTDYSYCYCELSEQAGCATEDQSPDADYTRYDALVEAV